MGGLRRVPREEATTRLVPIELAVRTLRMGTPPPAFGSAGQETPVPIAARSFNRADRQPVKPFARRSCAVENPRLTRLGLWVVRQDAGHKHGRYSVCRS